MKKFKFYSALFVEDDGTVSCVTSVVNFESFEDALMAFNRREVMEDSVKKEAFVPVYFKEIGNLSGKAR